MAFCNKCGSPVPDGQGYCQKCVNEARGEQEAREHMIRNPIQKHPSRLKYRVFWVIVIFIITITSSVGMIWYFENIDNNNETPGFQSPLIHFPPQDYMKVTPLSIKTGSSFIIQFWVNNTASDYPCNVTYLNLEFITQSLEKWEWDITPTNRLVPEKTNLTVYTGSFVANDTEIGMLCIGISGTVDLGYRNNFSGDEVTSPLLLYPAYPTIYN